MTTASGMTRGTKHMGSNRLARAFAKEMTVELWPNLEPGTTAFREKEGAVYVAARNYVIARALKH